MSERRAFYTGDPEPYTCPKCGQQVGCAWWEGDLMLLALGGVIVRTLDGVCSRCGTGIHYSVNEQKLAQLLKRLNTQTTDRPK